MKEKTITSKNRFTGRLLKLDVITVKLPDGNFTTREIVKHPGAVAVLPFLKDKIVLIKQYRKPIGKILYEIPAGTLNPKEQPVKCAQRELIEEIGYRALNLKKLLKIYPSPGYTDEVIHLFIAKNLKRATACCDSDEFIKVEVLTKNQIRKLFKDKKITDAKTILALSLLNII